MINIFNPDRIFKDELINSWCDGVVTISDKNRIPIEKNPPSLSLKALGDAEYFIVALPLNKSWNTIDCSDNSNLNLNVSVGHLRNKFIISMVSMAGDSEIESNSIDLDNYGFMCDCDQHFRISLDDFKNDSFDISKVRLLKFIGYGSYDIKLSKIYID